MTIRACYRLNGNANDASGNGYNGTATNVTFSQTNGKLDLGAGFNGTSSRIVTPVIDYSSSQKLTISLWIYLKSTTQGMIFESSSNYNVYPRAFTLFWNGSNFELATGGASGANSYLFGSNILINRWYHLVALIDRTNSSKKVDMYIDGKKATSTLNFVSDYSTNVSNANYQLYIGSRAGTSVFINAAIDNLQFDLNYLTPAKIKNDYSKAIGFF